MKDLRRNIHPIDFDAFSHGQINSKLWLCEKLEAYFKTLAAKPLSVSIYGSWIGLLPFMLLSRGQLQIRQFDLYDIDQDAHVTASKILDYWKFAADLKINHHVQDCNHINHSENQSDLIINTSCEHILTLDWWNRIPSHTHFCLQSTDMKHPTHVSSPESLEAWKGSLQLHSQQISFSGEQFVSYDTFSFRRWMILGRK